MLYLEIFLRFNDLRLTYTYNGFTACHPNALLETSYTHLMEYIDWIVYCSRDQPYSKNVTNVSRTTAKLSCHIIDTRQQSAQYQPSQETVAKKQFIFLLNTVFPSCLFFLIFFRLLFASFNVTD